MNTTQQLTNREQMNYLIALAFSEQRDQIDRCIDEPSESWLPFLGELAVKILDFNQ